MIYRNVGFTPTLVAVAFALLATMWGLSFVAIEVGLAYFPPLLFAGARYAIAGTVVLAYAAVVSDWWIPQHRKEWLGIAVAGTLVIALFHGLLYVGELYISGAIAAVILGLIPILTAAFAAVVLPDHRVGTVEIVGFGLGILGIIVIADPTAAGMGTVEMIGIGLIFLAAVAFSIGAVLLRPIRTEFPIAALQGWAMVTGAAILCISAALLGESPSAIVWNRTSILSLGYLTAFSGVLAFFIYFALLDEVGPTQLHLVSYAEPVVAVVGSWILLGYLVEAQALVGFLAIVAGFTVLERREIADYLMGYNGVSRSRF